MITITITITNQTYNFLVKYDASSSNVGLLNCYTIILIKYLYYFVFNCDR